MKSSTHPISVRMSLCRRHSVKLSILSTVQLHNSFLISIISSSTRHAPPTPPPEASGSNKPPRKRRRTLPYQGPSNGSDDFVDGDDGSLRSERLKKWTIGVGRRERDRIKNIEAVAPPEKKKRRVDVNEIAQERGIPLVKDLGAPQIIWHSLMLNITSYSGTCRFPPSRTASLGDPRSNVPAHKRTARPHIRPT